VNGSDLRDWFGTELGLQEFVRSLKFFTTEAEYALLLKWVSRRGQRLNEAEIDWVEGRALVLRELLERWEPVEVLAALRCVAQQGELRLD